MQGYQAIGAAGVDDGTSWRRGFANQPETAVTELEEAGAMARSDLEPEDQAAIIAVLEYVITNFRREASSLRYKRSQMDSVYPNALTRHRGCLLSTQNASDSCQSFPNCLANAICMPSHDANIRHAPYSTFQSLPEIILAFAGAPQLTSMDLFMTPTVETFRTKESKKPNPLTHWIFRLEGRDDQSSI